MTTPPCPAHLSVSLELVPASRPVRVVVAVVHVQQQLVRDSAHSIRHRPPLVLQLTPPATPPSAVHHPVRHHVLPDGILQPQHQHRHALKRQVQSVPEAADHVAHGCEARARSRAVAGLLLANQAGDRQHTPHDQT